MILTPFQEVITNEKQFYPDGASAELHGSLGRGSKPHEPHVNPTTMMRQKGLSTIRKPVITDHSLNLVGISL